MNIQRINITIEQLRQIPDHERALIVVLAHALNEVNVLNKPIFLCTNFDIEPRWKAHAHASQAFVLARTLIGKLNEAWNAIQKGYFGSQLSKKYATSRAIRNQSIERSQDLFRSKKPVVRSAK